MYALTLIPFMYSIPLILSGRRLSFGIFVLFSLIVIAVFSAVYGLRDFSSGTDSYIYAYSYIGKNYNGWEAGYVLWLKALQLIGSSWQVYFLLSTVLVFVLLACASYNIYKSSGSSLLATISLLLFSCSFVSFDLYTNGLRQGLAMTVAILCVSYYVRGGAKVAFFLSLLAPLFHSIYLVFSFSFLMAILLSRRFRFVSYLLLAISTISLISVMYGFDWLKIASSVLSEIGLYESVEDKLDYYSKIKKGSLSELNFFGKMKVYLILSAAMVSSLILTRSAREPNVFLSVLASMLVVIYVFLSGYAYSYRVLYIVSSISPFLIISLMQVVMLTTKSKCLTQVASGFVVALCFLNYLYFVIVRGGLADFNYYAL